MEQNITWSVISLINSKREANQITWQMEVDAGRVADFRTDHHEVQGVHERQEEE